MYWQRNLGMLKNGSDCDRERTTAIRAVEETGATRACPPYALAVPIRNADIPDRSAKPALKPVASFIVIMKNRVIEIGHVFLLGIGKIIHHAF